MLDCQSHRVRVATKRVWGEFLLPIAQHSRDGGWVWERKWERKRCGWNASLTPGVNIGGVFRRYQKIMLLIGDQVHQNLPHFRE